MPKKIISLDELSRFKDNLDLILEDKANVDGNYPTMHVGLADDLYYKGGQGSLQTKPFIFQATGTDSNTSTVQIGNFASFRSLRGNSVALNQLIQNGNFTNTNDWNGLRTTLSASDNTLTATCNSNSSVAWGITHTGYTTIKDHYYLIKFSIKHNIDTSKVQQFDITFGVARTFIATQNKWNDISFIIKASSSFTFGYQTVVRFNNTSDIQVGTDYLQFKNCVLIDLTLMFGAGNEPTSVLEFNRLFPLPYYSYNAGTLLSCKVNGIKNVGYNAYDNDNANDYIRVVAGQTYTLEGSGSVALYDFEKNLLDDTFVSESALPDNCHFVKITGGGDSTTCFHLTWDGSRTGYEEYKSETYPLPNIELKSAGSAYDEILPTGKLIRRMGSYTFTGEERWVELSSGWYYTAVISSLIKRPTSQSVVGNAITNIFPCVSQNAVSVNDKVFAIHTNGVLSCHDSSIASANDMASAWAGKTIYFELATSTEEEVAPYQQIQPIDDFGTQEFLYDSDIDIPIPQGYEAYYPANYTALVDQLYRHTDGDAYKLVLETELNAKVLNFMTAISGYDSTKTQTLKNVSGTLTWVDDE